MHWASFLFEDIVDIFPMFGRIGEAAGVAQPWGLLERRGYRPARRGQGRRGLGRLNGPDGVVNSAPEEGIVYMVGKSCGQERLEAAEGEIVIVQELELE